MFPFRLEPFDSLDKSIYVEGPVSFYIDNDDVPSDQNAILARRLVDVLNTYWTAPSGFFCENEDCDYFDLCSLGSTCDCPECGSLFVERRISL